MKRLVKLIKNPKHIFVILNQMKLLRFLSDEKLLKLIYWAKYGKKLNLENPKSFNEKIQWLKLYNRNPEYTKMVDKYEVKEYLKSLIGEEYIIPNYGVWDKFDEIDFDKLPNQFVLKCTHDSGGLIVCKDKSKLDIKKAKKIINRSLKANYFIFGREWAYKDVKPRIIAEKFIETTKNKIDISDKEIIESEELQSNIGLLDYKFICCEGKVKGLFMDIGLIGSNGGHAKEYFRNVYDRDFNLLPVLETRENYPQKINKPINYDKMIELAEKISKNIPFLRVDLYNVNGTIMVGELTFYHGSGLSNVFKPVEWDEVLGEWINLENIEIRK